MHKKYVRFKRDLNRRRRAAQNSAERRVDREGEGQGRDTERAFAFIKETFSRKTKRLLFCGGGQAIAGRLGCAEEGGEVQKKGRAVDCSSIAADGKAKAESLECGSAASGHHKKFRPSAAEASAQLRCKAQNRQREYFCFCAWFFGTAGGYR